MGAPKGSNFVLTVMTVATTIFLGVGWFFVPDVDTKMQNMEKRQKKLNEKFETKDAANTRVKSREELLMEKLKENAFSDEPIWMIGKKKQ